MKLHEIDVGLVYLGAILFRTKMFKENYSSASGEAIIGLQPVVKPSARIEGQA